MGINRSIVMQKTKKTVKSAIGHLFKYLCPYLLRNSGHIVLMYHRVVEHLPREKYYDSGMFVTTSTLEKNIIEIKKHYEIVTLDILLENRYSRNKKLCSITFDDGWLDNYQYALPILKKHKIPATIFIPVNYIATERKYWFQEYWDAACSASSKGILDNFINYFTTKIEDIKNIEFALNRIVAELKMLNPSEISNCINKVIKKLDLNIKNRRHGLNWEEINIMEREGILFGSHGMNHHILPKLNYEHKKEEIRKSYQKLNNMLKNFSPYFCFPNGDWDNECIQIAKDIGYAGAVTTKLGMVSDNDNLFLVNRIGMHEDICSSEGLFWFRILQAMIENLKK